MPASCTAQTTCRQEVSTRNSHSRRRSKRQQRGSPARCSWWPSRPPTSRSEERPGLLRWSAYATSSSVPNHRGVRQAPRKGFEIVRRRLFEPLDSEGARQRDVVVKAYAELYRNEAAEFPAHVREADYARRMAASYPIHPELFDRLFTAWSELERFQRTRGVLRLMATVIHELWERQDGGLLISPASVPIGSPAVTAELTRYLEEGWDSVIESDVDGENSLPMRLDRENPSLGRYSAARRVARTIYMGSAPVGEAANRGIDGRAVKLGCAQPGEAQAIFGDALRRLSDVATYLYADGRRYWFARQPSVTSTAKDRAAQFSDDEATDEIARRLRATRERAEFAGIHCRSGLACRCSG